MGISTLLSNNILYFLENIDVVDENSVLNETICKEEKKGNPPTKKNPEKHARFSVANVMNSATKDSGGQIDKSNDRKDDEEVS